MVKPFHLMIFRLFLINTVIKERYLMVVFFGLMKMVRFKVKNKLRTVRLMEKS